MTTNETDYSTGNARRMVSNLRIGDRVDLEGDIFADPNGATVDGATMGDSDHPEFEFEFETVAAITVETDDCTRVDFESGFGCGFPPNHMVDVDGEQVREGGEGVQSGGDRVQSAPEKLPVIFRMSEGEVVALFPTLGENHGQITCYAHVGQHSAAHVNFMQAGRRATPEEYADLLAELRGIYEADGDVVLEPRQRDHPTFRDARAKAWRA